MPSIFSNRRLRRRRDRGCGIGVRGNLFRAAFAIQMCQFGDLAAIELGRGETQFFFERLFQNLNILILTKDEWKDEPVVSSSDLSVGAAITLKGLVRRRETSGGVQ